MDERQDADDAEPAPEGAARPDDLGRLEQERDEARARAIELEDRVKRLQAEFLNDTRRIARQAEADRGFAIQKVVVDLLPIVDAIHHAGEGLGEGEESRRLKEGIELLARQLDETLGRHGVERIEAEGKPFDPARHEALAMVDDASAPPGSVARIVRPGFTLNGRVVRPALVTVVRAAPPPASE